MSNEATRNFITIPNNSSVSITTILNNKAQSQSIYILKNAIKLHNWGNPKPQDDQCRYVLRERLGQMKQQGTPLQFQTITPLASQQS
jgi:hypothetical protein